VVVLKEEITKLVLWVDMAIVVDKDMEEGEADSPLVSIMEKLVMSQGFVPNHTCFVHIAIVSSMSPNTILTC
jgi:hypothetical protein